jgi:UDP-glucose 4-epimerase
MAYLVTGGTGFIGSYTVRDLLKTGKDIVCLQKSGITDVFRMAVGEHHLDKVKIIQGDVSNTLQVFDVIKQNKIDTVVHCAAILSASGSISSEATPPYGLQVNIMGMNNLLEAARLFSLRKIVWTGTVQSLGKVGDLYKGAIGDDSAVFQPDNLYSASKLLCETMGRVYFNKFGVDCLGIRMGLQLGIGKSKMNALTNFLKGAATGVPVTMAAENLDQPRALGYIDNMSDLIKTACEAPPTRTRNFNSVDWMVSCRQLAEAAQRVNPKARINLKDKVLEEEQTWAGIAEPELDITGIRKELNWKPKYNLEESLARIFNYYRQQEGLPTL